MLNCISYFVYAFFNLDMLNCILYFAHIRDHSGGNEEMKEEYPNIRIYGGIHDQVNNVTK